MAATGPNPGKTPVNVPTSTPIKQRERFSGWKAVITHLIYFQKLPI